MPCERHATIFKLPQHGDEDTTLTGDKGQLDGIIFIQYFNQSNFCGTYHPQRSLDEQIFIANSPLTLDF